jgi:NADH dehydrogenase
MKKTSVLIVGGGFAGINAAKILVQNPDIQVTMLDRRNHHLFQPLLYQVATAGLSPADIATPIRAILGRYKNSATFLAEVKSVDLSQNKVTTDFRDFSFDYLILACGAQHSYFGHNEWEEHAPGLKTLEQAREIRRRVFLAFELAERESDSEKIKSLLTFVVIGGGPTGVELAGTLGEISRFALEHEFSHIDPSQTRIVLLEAGDRILPSFSAKSSARAAKDLAKLGVEVLKKTAVTNILENRVEMGADHINAATILWAAGVKPSKICQTLNVAKDRVGRVIIEKDLSIKDHANVFAIGDMASFVGKNGLPLPGVAPVAIQQGKACARNILNDLLGLKRQEFKYVDKGQMAAIGRNSAIVEFRSLRMGGIFAWVSWLFVHIYYLIGFKNRLFVFMQWAISFISFRRGVRIIQSQGWKSSD